MGRGILLGVVVVFVRWVPPLGSVGLRGSGTVRGGRVVVGSLAGAVGIFGAGAVGARVAVGAVGAVVFGGRVAGVRGSGTALVFDMVLGPSVTLEEDVQICT